MMPEKLPISDAQLMATVLCPKFTAAASAVGSSLIIRDVIQIRKNTSDELSTRHRILAGMSVCDIISSSAWFLTSWPVPEDLPFGLWNVGNRRTCSAQGFFIHLGIGTVTYNACLALYYLLVIRYGWKNEYIAKRVEPWMHFVAVGFALSTGVASLALNIFNPIGFGFSCSITSPPPMCAQSSESRSPTDCIHGDDANIYLIAFWVGPACCIIVFLAMSLFLVYWRIRTVESSSSHFQSQPGRLQQRFALQAFLYVGAMFITWGPMIGVYIHREVASKPPNFWIIFWTIFILPTQGFFNALIYFRNTKKQPRRSNNATEQMTASFSTDSAKAFRQWGSFMRLSPRRDSAARVDPVAAVVARVIQEEKFQDSEEENAVEEKIACVTEEEDFQDLEEEDPVVEQIDRNGATEGSRRLPDLVGMELSNIPEANLEHWSNRK